MNRGSTLVKIALAWLPFVVLWTLFMMMYAEDATLTQSLMWGVVLIGGAALLGLPVWWLSGRYAWPERLQLRFYGVHLFSGLAYAITWAFIDSMWHTWQEGGNPFVFLVTSRILGWQILMGLMFYGLIAGVSYSVRNRKRLSEQQKVAARAEALAAQAQLQTLRAQLNPHFLFNALHSFSTLIRHDPEAGERAVERLGDLLRYALDEGQDEVTLGDELSFTEHYLDLERLRLESRLLVESEFDSEALECLVPSFTLQPLVENAIQHSIAPRPEGGKIFISAAIESDDLVIRVRDDGSGNEGQPRSNGRGLGLKILRQRLEALYGDAATLKAANEPGTGFCVTVSLPRHHELVVDRVES